MSIGEHHGRFLPLHRPRRVRAGEARRPARRPPAAASPPAGGGSRPGCWPTTFGKSAGVANTAASCRAPPPLEQDVADDGERHERASASSASGHSKLTGGLRAAQEWDERPQPVALGREHDVADAERRELVATAARSVGGGGEALAQARAARVDAELAAGLRVDEPAARPRRQLLLARVADLDRDDVVAGGELDQRRTPVARPAEVRDDGDERTLPAPAAPGSSASPNEVAPPPPARAPRRSACSMPSRPARPWRGGRTRGSHAAERDHAEPVAAAGGDVRERERGALGDVRLAPVGGAERIEADASTTTQLTSTRSARWTRTCGSRVRAVTFQSIMRTSSPGSYGRTCASSVPAPSRDER